MDQRTSKYIALMKQAEQATNRQEAIDCIREATKLLDNTYTVPEDRYSRWCGGRNGFDDYVERLH